MPQVHAPLVGMRFHPPATEVLSGLGQDEVLELRREPDNEHDSNAIQVFLPSGWQENNKEHYGTLIESKFLQPSDDDNTEVFLGYIARDVAENWAPIFDLADEIPKAKLTFGTTGRPQVTIDLPDEEASEEENFEVDIPE